MLDPKIMTFLCVCRHMNYTRAAEELHITQPAVSQHIRGLEEYYGARLFDYRGRRLELTPAGRELERAADTMANDAELLRDRLSARQPVQMPLHFGVTMTIGEYVIGRPLAAYMRNHPGGDLRMEIANTETLVAKMKTGNLNLCLVEGTFQRKEFDWERYDTVRYIAVCSVRHHFRKKIRVLEDLLDEQLILREPGSGTRAILERQLSGRNLSVEDFRSSIQIGGMHTILELLEEDAGISFMYQPAAQEMIRKGVLVEIPLQDFQVRHDFSFIWEKNSIFGERYRSIAAEITQLRKGGKR